MKTFSTAPLHRLTARLAADGWEILCAPGPLATLLYHLSQDPGPIRVEWVEGQHLNVIPYTAALDLGLTLLVDDLADLRYATRHVQLELFCLEAI